MRIGKPQRRRLRRLQFDTLEDRRLLAGLTISVFEDVDASGDFDGQVDNGVSGRVLFLDANRDGVFNSNEPFAVSDLQGVAVFESLGQGSFHLEVLGQPSQRIPVQIDTELDAIALSIAVTTRLDNQKPDWKSATLNYSGIEDEAFLISSQDFLTNSLDNDGDPLYFFVASQPSFASAQWTENGGLVIEPFANFDKKDSLTVRAYDGYEWSEPLSIEIRFQSVDDLPTGFDVSFQQSVPENSPGAVLGAYTIDDVDGGAPSFEISDSRIVASDGVIRLAPNVTLDFESSNHLQFTIKLIGDFGGATESIHSATTEVLDNNDPSTSIIFSGNSVVQELRRGHRFGLLAVIDQDQNESFTWQVSDARFIVNENNELRLLPESFLVFGAGAIVPVLLTATSVSGGDSLSTKIDINVEQGPPPFQNQAMPLDVNNDGDINSLDLMAVVNALNSSRQTGRDLSVPPMDGTYNFVDPNGDRFLSSLDLMAIVNYLSHRRRALAMQGGGRPASGSGSSSGNDSPGAGNGTQATNESLAAPPQIQVAVAQTIPITPAASSQDIYAAALNSYEYAERRKRSS